jgi:hemerythrin superfamily protein
MGWTLPGACAEAYGCVAMSIQTTKPVLDAQAGLRQQVEQFLVVARDLPSLSVSGRIDVVEGITAFLAEVLLPHALIEQRVLYPRAALLLNERDDSDDVAADRATVRELLTRLATEDARDAGALQEVLYALYTVLSAHFWREEAVFVRLAALPDEARVHEMVEEVVSESDAARR